MEGDTKRKYGTFLTSRLLGRVDVKDYQGADKCRAVFSQSKKLKRTFSEEAPHKGYFAHD